MCSGSGLLPRRAQLHQHFLLNHFAVVINRVDEPHLAAALAGHLISKIKVGERGYQLPARAGEPPDFELLPSGHAKWLPEKAAVGGQCLVVSDSASNRTITRQMEAGYVPLPAP